MKIKWVFFEIFFIEPQLNSSTHKILNSKSIVQKISTSGDQSHLKLQTRVQKIFVSQLWMLTSSNLYGQTSWNFYHMILNNLSTRFYGYILKKCFFLFSWASTTNMAVFNGFWEEIGLETLGVKCSFTQY